MPSAEDKNQNSARPDDQQSSDVAAESSSSEGSPDPPQNLQSGADANPIREHRGSRSETLNGLDDGTASSVGNGGSESAPRPDQVDRDAGPRDADENRAVGAPSNEPSNEPLDEPTLRGGATSAPGASASDEVVPIDDFLMGLPSELANHPRYRPTELLGQGGMGSVYKATHRVMDRIVALKVIRPELTRSDLVERFQREIRAAAKLSHPNIVIAHDAEQAGNIHFLVVEFVDGQSLDRVIAKEGPLGVTQACDIIRQAADGLDHAFRAGMVHRDIKPQNLMYTEDGEAKILDFGLALLYSDASVTSALTHGGGVMGTPDYIAPEQADDAHAADTRSDIYSLGCTLYFLLRGAPPFAEGSIVQKLMAHVEKAPPSLHDFRDDIPDALCRVIAKATAKKPNDRFQTPAAFAMALERFVDSDQSPILIADIADPAEPAPSKPFASSPQSESTPASHDEGTSAGDPIDSQADRSSDSAARGAVPSSSNSDVDSAASGAGSKAATSAETPPQHRRDNESHPAPDSKTPTDSQSPVPHSPPGSGSDAAAPHSQNEIEYFDAELISAGDHQPEDSKRHRIPLSRNAKLGRVAMFCGLMTVIYAWIPFVGLLTLPIALMGTIFALIAVARSFREKPMRFRFNITALILCLISLGFSWLSWTWTSSLF